MDLTDDRGIAAAERLGVRLTHPERVVYSGQGITKARIAAYYDAVAERMLPHVARRPLSLVRCPQGPAHPCFFQKHDTGGFPEAIRKVPVAERDGGAQDYLYVEDLAGILAAVQMNTLEFHIWGARNSDLERPDRVVFDIDPDEGLDFADVRLAALDLRDRLAALGLETFAMVTGGKGIHVIAPLTPAAEWPDVKDFCKAFAQRLEDDEPERFVANIRKARRKGRMFVDYLRNERGSTAVTPFSTRSRDGAPCAVPVGWDEVERLDRANGFTISDAAAPARAPDPWRGYFDIAQRITPQMTAKLG